MPEPQENDAVFSDAERKCLFRAQRAEARLTEMLAGMPEAYVTINRDWVITGANERAAQVNRMAPEDFVGKNVWAVWPGTVGSELEVHYHRAMKERVPTQFKYYYPDDDTWFELTVQPTEEGIAVFYLETTQRIRAEEALKESERRYRAFTELNPQLILMADAQGQLTYANQRLLDYTGMTLEESLGNGWHAALHPEDEVRVLQAWMDALVRDVDFEIETRIRRGSDGEFRWFWARGLPVRDEQNETLYWLGVCVDVHEHRMALEELKNLQKETEHQRLEFETVYRTAPIGLALFDPVEFRFLRVNDHKVNSLGLPMEEILGRPLFDIAPIEGLRELFEQVAAGHPITNQLVEGELPTQPGQHRYWTVNYNPVYGPDGAVRAITTASLEITAQKRAEMALIQSEKLAAVGRLASSISHEINNPLESVTNLLYLAAHHEKLPNEVRGYLRTAQEELARVSHIATQSLRFHRQTMNPTQVGAAELMNSVLDLYHGKLINSGIQVHSAFLSANRIVCFENDVRQVLSNLIANSIDATRHGGRLLLRTHDATDWKTGRKGIRMTIADTGHGMSADTKKRVFEPFYTTKTLNGTGLGLWISLGIVARHHGRLALKSSQKPGRCGTVFTMFLPDGPEDTADTVESISISIQPVATHS